MRPRPSIILPGLLALGLLVAARAGATPERVGVRSFRPTQALIGKAAALDHYERWKADAKKKGISLAEYARTIIPQKEFGARLVPVVIDHAGRIRNTDAHHRIYALLRVAKKTGVEVEVPIQVLADYTGQGERRFAKAFVNDLGKGLFAEEVRHKGAVAKMRSLPKRFAKLRDTPLRSTVDVVFDRMGLTGGMFTDYIEFHIGDALVKRGVYERLRERKAIPKGEHELRSARVFDKKVLDVVESMMREPAMLEMLRASARNPEKLAAIEAALDK